MNNSLHRYPGAQPFRDDEFSRRTFFGREQASIALTDQIIANRLVVVYAKSGLGKTSLLSAGVAPRLRESGTLPLFVRVNDIEHGPVTSILERIRAEAERQKVEYVEGDRSSLWSFFKSVEFWRGDLLLTPVLILDQFEELFTLQSEEARENFLSELGHLVRGVPPPSLAQTADYRSDTPPPIRLVLSLREDFLGILEEASDHIPEIMDRRFRLAPLTAEMAATAITGPAAIEDRQIATRAFRLQPECVNSILDYLASSSAAARALGSRYVEPFHLQLVCQRIEKIVAFKQKTSSEQIVVTFNDLGGEQGVAQTLENFYTDAIRSLPVRHLRGAVRLLCEQYLISPEGRRLSLEEHELRRQLKLPRETLDQLVERRLLRTDRRSDSTYYELSHDALVQPVLATRRMRALALGWVFLVAGSIVSFGAATVVVLGLVAWISDPTARRAQDFFIVLLLFAIAAAVGALGTFLLRAGNRRRRRYRRHLPGESLSLPTLLPLKDRVLGWVMVTVGSTSFALWGVAALYLLAMLMALSATHGKIPHSLAWTQDKRTMDKWQQLRDHPSIEVPWNLIQFPTIILFGWLLLRRGASKLWPHKFAHRSKAAPVPGLDKPPSLAWAILKLLLGACALVVATVSFATMEKCVSIWNGILPNALFRALSADIVDACQNLSTKDYLDTISVIVFFFTVLGVSITLLRRGVLDISTLMLHRRVVRLEPERKRAVVTAAVAGVVALILVFYLRPARFVPNRPAAAQAEAASLGPSAVTSPPIWAAGDNATILYSGDGGRTWETRIHGTGWLYDIALVTPQLGWAVGAGGTIWHTDNGFESYKPQNSGTHSDLSVVKFTTPLLGWTVGHEGTILHTQDGGRTWQSQHSGTQTHLISLAFATSLSGWATGNDGTILHTDDGGSTWRGQSSGTTEALRGVAFATPHWGWVVGENGTILHTGDNGETWQPQNSGTVRGLAEIAAVTPQLAWAVGGKGTILHTEDGGLTWTPQFSGTRSDLVEVRFPTEQSGWAVGDDGTIVQTRDGGRRWTLQNSGTKADLRGTAFAEPGGGIGVRFNESETPDGRRSHGSAGAIIVGVVPNSPAAEAGLRTGDTIVSVNDKPVNNSDEFIAEIFPLKPGTVAKVCYVRQRKKTTANLKVGDAAKLFASQTAR